MRFLGEFSYFFIPRKAFKRVCFFLKSPQLQVTLTSGEVDGWVMLHHPDLGDLIRHLGFRIVGYFVIG